MAKAMKCDICNSFFDLYVNETSSYYEVTMTSLPNNIIFNVKFDDGLHIDSFVHATDRNEILSVINKHRASYDVCPDCMIKIMNTIEQIANNKEES